MKFIHYSLFVVLSFIVYSCKPKTVGKTDEFKKTELLNQLAENYILPEYKHLQENINDLSNSWTVFENQPSKSQFDTLIAQWKKAYIRFQYVKMFDFGPGMNQNLAMNLGTFPTDTLKVESNIISKNYNLNSITNYVAIGFPALEYLFYSKDAYQKITTDNDRKNYARYLIIKMKTDIDKTVSEWSTYSNSFMDGSSNASTSPFSLLINNYIRDYEILKWTKLGYPLGVNTLNVKNPAYLEARKSGIGKELLRANILALQQVYHGKGSNGKNGKSMHDYLLALGKTTTATTIETNWVVFLTQIDGLPTSLETALDSDTQKMIDLYNAIHYNTIALKTDMVSAFGILITYSDNDGD